MSEDNSVADLGNSLKFGVIAFDPMSFHTGKHTLINGSVGIGDSPHGPVSLSIKGTIDGNLVTEGPAPTSIDGKVTGRIVGDSATLAKDIAHLKHMSAALGNEHGKKVDLDPKGTTIVADHGHLDSSGNYVFTTDSGDLNNITIEGTASQYVVINIPAGDKVDLGNIKLEGGITADHIIFNYTGDSEVHSNYGDTFQGILLAPHADMHITGLTIDGHLFGGESWQHFVLSLHTSIDSPVCFLGDTRVLTEHGEVRVADLQVGDRVVTVSGDQRTLQPVRWIGRNVVSRIFADPLRVLPIRITAGALGDNMPTRDLLVSPGHGILMDDVLVVANALVNGVTVLREHDMPTVFTYYHIELDNHALLLAEGTPAESFLPGAEDTAFENWPERVAPEQATELPYLRAKSHRQVPYAVRQRLAARIAIPTAA